MLSSYKQRETLDRVIGFRGYVALGFGVMVGVGWVVYAGQWIEAGGVGGAILAFLLGALLLWPVGRCYAELTSALPLSGGEMAFTYKAFGSFWSFLAAWGLSLNYIAVTPFETIAMGMMTEAILPSIRTETLYEIGGYRIAWSTIIPGILAAVWVTWLNWKGAKASVLFQTFATVLMLLSSIIFLCVALSRGSPENLAPLFAGEGSFWTIVPASIAAVLVVVPFFLTGFDCIPQAAEESGVKMAPRQIGLAILSTIALGATFYSLILLALGYSVPGTILDEILTESEALPMAKVFRESFGYDWAARLVLFAALLGILSTLNGIFMAATRLLFAQGRGGLLPHWFAELHPVHHTPKNAVLVVGAIALIGPFLGKAALLLIVNCYSLVFSLIIIATSLTLLQLRKTAPELERPYNAGRLSGPASLLVGVFLVLLMAVPGSPGFLGPEEFMTVAVWMAFGAALYAIRQRIERLSDEEQAYMILGVRSR